MNKYKHIAVQRLCLVIPLILLLLFANSGGATAPTSPVRFDTLAIDVDKEPWALVILCEAKLVEQLNIEILLYRRDKLLDRTKVPISTDLFKQSKDKDIHRAQLSVKPANLEKLELGVYSTKVIVTAHLSSEKNTSPLTIQHWRYLQKGSSTIRPLTISQYSAIADPSVIDVDHLGHEMKVKTGLGAKSAIPLNQLKSSALIPLGRLGGLRQEKEVFKQQQKQHEDEQNER